MSYSTTFVPISVGDITIIIPVDIAPDAKNDLIANIPERHVDLGVPISVIDNDTDENPSTLTVTLVSQTSANGQPLAVSDDNQTIIYTTLPGWNRTWVIDDNPPFSHEFRALSVGSHTIDYQATDDEDGDSTVVSQTIEVTETPNEPPTISVTAPTAGAVYLTSQTVEVRADVADNDGTIALVEARVVGDNSWTPVLEPPYHIDLGTLAAGTHNIEKSTPIPMTV
jgi:hypothetical protein